MVSYENMNQTKLHELSLEGNGIWFYWEASFANLGNQKPFCDVIKQSLEGYRGCNCQCYIIVYISKEIQDFFSKNALHIFSLKDYFQQFKQQIILDQFVLEPSSEQIVQNFFQTKHKHVAGDVNFEAQKAEVEVTHTKVESEAER